MRDGNLPQVTPAAFVLPLGMRGGQPDAAAGMFRQFYDDVVAIVLVVEFAGDATGGRALPPIDALVRAIVDAMAGWGPGNQVGVFRLMAGRLVSVAAGTVIYQLDFAINDQLRIAT